MNDLLHEIVLVIAMLLALSAWSSWEEVEELSQLGCITDTECMAYCPVDDIDCDGGPQ